MDIFKKISQKISPISYLLLISAFFYFFLSVLTYHPDNKQVLFWASIDGLKLVNVWERGEELYPSISQFNYPPAHYVVDKLLYFVAKPIAGDGYDEWLASPNDYDRFLPQLSRFAFATKSGLILLGIFSGFLVYKVVSQFSSKKKALIAAALWLFNPITIYSIPMMGQNDVIAICFFLLGWLALKNKKILATIMFGIGTSVKMIPIVWVPFLLVSSSRKNWISKLGILAGTGLIYAATIFPFLKNENFQRSILTGNHNQRFLYADLSFGFSEAVYVVPFLLMLLLAGLFTKKLTSKNQLALSSFSLMMANMIMLSFTHFHPQWWTWVILFWSMWITTVDTKKIGAAMTISTLSFGAWFLILLFFKDSALKLAMLQPLNPELANLPTLRSFLDARGIDMQKIVNMAYTWLAGTSVIAIGFLYKSNLPDFHEKIVLPAYINKFFLQLKRNSLFRKSMILLFLLITFLSFGFLSQIVPTSIATKPPDSVRHEPLIKEFSIEYNSEYKNLERFDLYLSDITLKASGSFSIKVSQDENIIYQQLIQGQNVGFDSLVRFDVPVLNNTDSKGYKISIEPSDFTDQDENIIMVGVTNPGDPYNSLAIRPYYSAAQDSSVIKKSLDSMTEVVGQSPFLFAFLILGVVVFL